MRINILCLYNDIMNLYGDNGNIKVIKYHLDELKIKYKIDYLTIDDEIDFSKYDLVTIGSGTEQNRLICLNHLLKYKKEIKKEIENNKFFLITGNALALFGKAINNQKALNIFDFSIEETERISKEIITKYDNNIKDIYGFINHQDKIIDNENIFKNNFIKNKNFYGTYILGPLLARNPEFTESFINELIKFKDPKSKKQKLTLDLEQKAYDEYIEFKKTKVFNSHKS